MGKNKNGDRGTRGRKIAEAVSQAAETDDLLTPVLDRSDLDAPPTRMRAVERRVQGKRPIKPASPKEATKNRSSLGNPHRGGEF